MMHPYKNAPKRAFWARAVGNGFDERHLLRPDQQLFAPTDAIMSAGSCFAANIVPYLERSGIRYVWTEQPHPAFAGLHAEAFSYHKFSAAYGNIYTTRHLRQLFERALGVFQPKEDRWYVGDAVVDPFRPGLTFPASGDAEFDALTKQHLECVIEAVRQADVFVFTLGLTEGWVSRLDGAVFPACPGTIGGTYRPDRHAFHNFRVAEVIDDLQAAFALMRAIKPQLRFIVSVSPVPLVATATDEHVLTATIYSKSVLRVAAQEVADVMRGVAYFPAYEIVTGPQAPYEFFEQDRRDPSRQAIDTVMGLFLARAGVLNSTETKLEVAAPMLAPLTNNAGAAALSAAVSELECEEAGSAV